MMPDACLRYFQGRAAEMLAVLERLVALDSPSGNAQAIDVFARAYGALLEDAGVAWRPITGAAGPHVFGELAPKAARGPPIVLVGHSDTVWPLGESARRPPRRSEGRLYGPGAYDMRAGLTILLFALRLLRELGRPLCRSVQVFISADEELGSRTAHPHMERLFPPAATAIVVEPPLEDGSLKAWRKGVGMYRLEVRGVEAHAGLDPERGASAIAEVARKVLELLAWADPGRGITLNVGELRGGIAANVIAGLASAGIDVRFDVLADGETIDRRLRELRPHDPRTRISIEGGIIFPPLAPDDRSRSLAEKVVQLGAALGLNLSSGKAGGGSDGSFLAARGLAVLDGLGVEGGGAHSQEEHILIERLPVRAALLALLLISLDEAGEG